MKDMLRKHYLAFLTALLVGIVCILPYVLPVVAIGDNYKGIPFLYQDNEEVYLSRIRDVTEGHFSIASPVFYEYKGVPNAQQPWGEWLYAFSGLVISTKFIFPAILFLLIYFLILRVSESKNVHIALFGALFCVLGFDMTRASFLKEIVTSSYHGAYLSIWTRLVNPITGGLLLISFFHLLLFVYEKRRWGYVISAGLILGCMTGYFFSFVLGSIVLGFTSLVFLYQKEYRLFGFCLCIYLVGFLLNIHYAWSLLNIGGFNPGKSGMLFTHEFLFNKVQFLTLILILLHTRFCRSRSWAISLIVCLACITSLNIQVVLGKTVWPAHFVQYTNLVAFIVCVSLFSWVPKMFFISGSVSVVFLSIMTIPSFVNNLDDFIRIQDRARVFDWVNKNLPDDCVILAYEPKADLAWAIPAYTKCDTYTSPYVFSAVPDERIMHNFLVILYMRGATPENVDSLFNQDDMREYFFRDWRDLFAHQPDIWLTSISDYREIDSHYSQLKTKIIENYKVFYKSGFQKELKKYKIDYIINETDSKQYVF